jgi:lipopolysaccharide assembly outer membrane protein LptD (OstA)
VEREEAAAMRPADPARAPSLVPVCLFLLIARGEGLAQIGQFPSPIGDTLRVTMLPDTVLTADTTVAVLDTLAVPESSSGVDSVITYSAGDSIVYSIADRKMHLFGEGSMRYKALGLTAERVSIDWTTATLSAEGVPDSTDTTGTGYRGLPDMVDRGETYRGNKVTYNFRTKKGKIHLGETEIADGFYYGEEIKKVGADELFVGHGRYTTCDLPHPHYYFGSPEMKIVVQQEVVARPIYLYVSDVPVAVLPFGVFPNKAGRRSGFLVPTYGENQRGRYLRGLGYYWAMSDYTDINLLADGYTNGSWVLHSNFRYALRYEFTGSLNGSYGNTFVGEPGDPGYLSEEVFNIRLGHHQDIDPTSRVDVDFTFTSGTFYQNTSLDYNELLRQQIISNATYQKSWEGTPHSMTVNVNRTQDLQSGAISQILPGISFSRSQTYPFRFGKETGAPEAWYENIGFQYSGQFRNVMDKILEPTADGATWKNRQGMLHSVPVNASSKVGYFTVNPFFNYTEKWSPRSIRKEFNAADSSVIVSEKTGFQTVRYFDTGVSLSTKLFGIVQPGMLGIKGIRHQFTPSVSYTYSPDWSEAKYGSWGSYRDASGNVIPYSFFEEEIFGGAPMGERQSIGLRFGNVFEMKTEADDTAAEDNKFQLLNLDVSTAYNFARDSLRFDEIGLGYRTAIGEALNIAGNSRFNLYQFDNAAGRRVDKFLLDTQGRLAQLTSFSISISTKLKGEKKATKAGPAQATEDSLAVEPGSSYIGIYDSGKPDLSIPWQLDLTWNFSQNQSNPNIITKSSSVNASLSFNLTDYWKIRASGSYDLENKQLSAPQITVYRDLHCWEMNFSWVPTGIAQHYQVEIRLKSPLLRDVKVTKQQSSSGVF